MQLGKLTLPRIDWVHLNSETVVDNGDGDGDGDESGRRYRSRPRLNPTTPSSLFCSPPLSPLLSSHCSSCFSTLPPLYTSPFPNNSHPVLLYCSPLCSAADSPIHLSAAEPRLLHLLHSHPSTYPHADSSDLRAALRLLHSLPATCPHPRISGLLTNRLKLIDRDDHLRIRDGARAMFRARTMREAKDENDAVLEEAALCLVLTNAVDVQDTTGRTLGIAVYDSCFSWINHSCSPNACYRFLLSLPSLPPQCADTPLLIVPGGQIESGVCSRNVLTKECGNYGPRVIVRSIKRINRGEEATITYTDLLQPKAMRQSELWSRYRFMCSCKRCSASPLTYVDCVLEDISAVYFNSSKLSSNISFNRDKATERLTDYIDDAIADYLSLGNPESSCERLEQVLTQGLFDNQPDGNEEKSELTYWLNPVHHLSLNAYTTLASAYKILADDLLTISSAIDNHVLKSFGMSRTSTAYSLLLAGAAHHLFNSESCLVVHVANYWTTAGESLLNLAKSSLWSEIVRWDLPVSDDLELCRIAKYKCSKCSLIDKFETYSFHDAVMHTDFEHASREFLDCVSDLTQKVWYFLVQGCRYLGLCKNPIEFCWLDTLEYSTESDVTQSTGTNCGNGRSIYGSEAEENTNQLRMYIVNLGVHCLLYGEYLAGICYGRYSLLTRHVQNILDREERFSKPCH